MASTLKRTPTRCDLRHPRRPRAWSWARPYNAFLLVGFPLLFTIVTYVLHTWTGSAGALPSDGPVCVDGATSRRLSLEALGSIEELDQRKAALELQSRALTVASDSVFLFIGNNWVVAGGTCDCLCLLMPLLSRATHNNSAPALLRCVFYAKCNDGPRPAPPVLGMGCSGHARCPCAIRHRCDRSLADGLEEPAG